MLQAGTACLCQSGKSYGECCQRVDQKLFAVSIHEAGHALSLPPEAFSHCSLLPSEKCPPCLAGDGEPCDVVIAGYEVASEGHTVCSKGFEHTVMSNIVYTVGGGAAEVACGAYEPERMDFPDWGRYPTSMISDFDNMERDFRDKQVDPRNFRKDVQEQFEQVVRLHKADLAGLWRTSRELRENGYLTR